MKDLGDHQAYLEMLQKLKLNYNYLECPGILVAHHGPFAWGRTVDEAVKNAELLEYIAKLAWGKTHKKILTTLTKT